MPQDPFIRESGPANDAYAITPADTDLEEPVRSVYVGGAGNLTIRTPQGTDVTFVGVPAGSIIPVRARQVRAATTATNLVGLV